MSDNRARYSSAPLQNVKKKPPRRAAVPQPPRRVGDFQDAVSAPGSFALMQIMLTIALPLFFIICLLVRSNALFIVFAVLSGIFVVAMWMLNAFVSNARLTMTIIHVAMIVVALFAVWISAPAASETLATQTSDNMTNIFSQQSSKSLTEMAEQKAAAEQPQSSLSPASASLAQRRLEEFMTAWKDADYDRMVDYSHPTWVQAKPNAKQALFQIRGTKTITEYQINDISGTDADSTRTVEMEALIEKSNGSAPQKYQFQVLMNRINDQWYIDPDSLTSPQLLIDPKSIPEPTVTIAPLVTQDPNLLLYYNLDGGRFYHVDANCKSVQKKDLPLTGTFYFRDVSNDTYKNLLPCAVCHAPNRP